MFRRVRQKLAEIAPTLYVKLAEYLLVSTITAASLLIVSRAPSIRATLSQAFSITVFIFLLSLILAAALCSAFTYLIIRDRFRKILSATYINNLTGVYISNVLRPLLKEKLERSKADRKPLSIVLIDIDGFKEINDSYSYAVGDFVLKEFAQILQSYSRTSSDIVVRYKQGDEFLIIAPETEGINARIFAERLRNMINGHEFQLGSTRKTTSLSMSAGVTELIHASDTLDSFLERAEKALSEAKQGKNRAVLLTDPLILE